MKVQLLSFAREGAGVPFAPVPGGAAVLLLPVAASSRLPFGWTREELLVVGFLAAAILACAIVWALTLHARVQEQTGMLLHRLQHIAALEESYRELFENANDMVFTCTLDGCFTSLNRAGERLTGYSRREALSKRIGDFIAPEYAAQAMQMLVEGARPEGGETMELDFLCRQGRHVSLEIRLRPVMAEGQAVGLQGIARDVSERTRAEETLRRSERKYHALFENANDIVLVFDPETEVILEANRRACEAYGLERGELIGRSMESFTRDVANGRQEIANLIQAGAATNYETIHLGRSGSELHLLCNATLMDYEGRTAVLSVNRDVTEIKRAERALALERNLLRTLIDTLPDYVYVKDREGRFLAANRTVALAMGAASPDELIGKTDLEFYPREMAEGFMADERQVLASGRALLNKDERGRTPGGSPASILTSKVPFRDAAGDVVGIVGVGRNITERKKLDEALRRSEQRYRLLFERNLAGVYRSTAEGRILDANDAMAYVFGFQSRQEFLTCTSWDLYFQPSDRERIWRQLREHGTVTNAEVAMRRKDGSVVWVLENATLVKSDDGTEDVTEGTMIDITARKRAEEALRKSESRFRRLAESNMIGVTFGDATGRFVYANDAYLSIIGYTRQDLEAGRVRWDAVSPPDQKQVAEMIGRKLATTGVVEPAETVHLHKDGRRVPVLIGLARLEGEEEQAIGFVIDLTERKRAEQELEDAKRAAEVANRAKSEFLANMSHEIRTPMNGIIGMTELALDTDLDREQRDYLGMVKESSENLLTLINDILDFSKIEAGKLTLDFTDFDLRDNLEHTVRSLAYRAHEKGLELAYEIAPEVSTALRGDPTRLRQIVVNLLGNAIKFTPQGEILVRVEALSVPEEETRLRFEVRDTGIGIPADKQRAIFDAFAQADGSMTRKYGGTGLGLAISRQLAEMMGGHLGVESEVGRGSTFYFTARFARQPLERKQEPPGVFEMPDLRKLRVLVVDDNATNRRILDAMLRHWDMKPSLAEGGAAGLALMRQQRQSGQAFPLVLLDAQMPDMDGFTLAEKIRNDPEIATATIMMLTSAGQRGDAARCRELGIGAYLIKPIRQSDLLDAILMTLGKRPARRGAALVTRHVLREARRRLRVLVVEDNLVNRQLAARLLEKQGHDVVLASNGREALATLAQSHTEFDAVVMDVQMPELDGLKTTAEIRAREKVTGGHLPIVAMTARAMKGDRERCLAAGMDGYVAKPLRPEVFLAEIEAACSGRAPAGTPNGRKAPSASPSTDRRANLLRRTNGDAELLGELAGLFARSSPQMLDAVRQAAARGDAKSLQFAAHQLKGSAANFGARRVCALAEKLEALGRRGDCARADEAVGELSEEVARLNQELRQFQKEGSR